MDANKHKPVISITAMAEELQTTYRDYGRKKKTAFKISVEKAYEAILSSATKPSVDSGGDAYSKLEKKHLQRKKNKHGTSNVSEDSSDDSDVDSEKSFSSDNPDYVNHKDTNSMNSFLKNMYRKSSSAPGSIVGCHSNPPSNPGSAASTPRRQVDSDSDQLFCIDRKGYSGIQKTRHSESYNTTGSPARKSREGTPTKSVAKNKKLLSSGVGEKDPDVIVVDCEDPSSKNTSVLENKSDQSSKSDNIVMTEKSERKLVKSFGEKSSKTGDKAAETSKDSQQHKVVKKRKKAPEKNSLSKKQKLPELQTTSIRFSDIGGNDKTLAEVCKLLVHMKHPEVYERLGVTPPRGFLLHGPPGCGKTLMAHAIAGELELPFLKVAATELVSGVSGESEEKIRDMFDQACSSAPCVMFLDEIDAITPKRETASKDMERRIVSQLLTCMDDLGTKSQAHVLVIGATNRPDSLDPALRRAGRFDREIALGIPDEHARKRILEVLCSGLRLSDDFDFLRLARDTPGYVGADLMALAREAAMVAVNRVFQDLQSNSDTKETPLLPDLHTLEENVSDVTKQTISETSEELPCDANAASTNDVTSIANADLQNAERTNVNAELSTNVHDMSSSCETNITSENKDQQSVLENIVSMEDSERSKVMEVSESNIVMTTDQEKNKAKSSDCDAAFKLVLSWLKDQPPLTAAQLDSLYITAADFKEALQYVQPSAKREGFATIPDVTWEDIGALKEVREELQMAILAPVQHQEQFKALGLTSPPGILLAGPPGCGKTLLAKAIANESGINFISVKGPELLNMYVGESERAVRQVFQRARNSSPCVIFFDELDALCPRRSDFGEGGASVRVVNQLLTEMDGLETRKQVFIMGATNRPDIIDPAILRPGRLDKLLYVGLPSPDDRLDILKTITKNGTKPAMSPEVDLSLIANHTQCEGLTGADLAALVRESAVAALREFMSQSQASIHSVVVTMSHFEYAFKKVRPSVTTKDQLLYERIKDRVPST